MVFAPSKHFQEINFKLANILFFCFPISFLLGNAVTNIIIISISLIGIFTFWKELHLIKKDNIFLALFTFFIILLISTLLDSWENPKNNHMYKSLSYIRYFFFFLAVSFFLKSGKINLKFFLISSFICTFSLSVDVVYQFINGKNLFGYYGYEKSTYHLAGFLKNEYIAGGYISKFFIFSLLFFPFIFKKLEKYKSITLIFLIIIFFSGVLYSGNRMPLIIFIFSMLLMIVLIKNLRVPITIGFFLCSIIFYISYNNSEKIKTPYYSFYDNASSMWKNLKKYAFKEYPELENQKGIKFKHYFFDQDFKRTPDGAENSKYKMMNFGSGHTVIYITALDLWTDSPVIGNGIKSFRIKCFTKLYLPNRSCEGHPHNYYLELLNDTGLVGTLVFFLFLFLIFRKKLLNIKKFEEKEKLLLLCLFIIVLNELFPIRSSGSFFSTSSSAYIFFLLGLFNGLKKIKI